MSTKRKVYSELYDQYHY